MKSQKKSRNGIKVFRLDPKSVRLGNLFFENVHTTDFTENKLIKICHLTDNEVGFNSFENPKTIFYKKSEILPISLFDIWNNKNTDYIIEDYSVFDITNRKSFFRIECPYEGIVVEQRDNSDVFSVKHNINGVNYPLVSVKYIHELQNIYYFLTGEKECFTNNFKPTF